jgi:signal transduction histidine kinase
VLKYRDEISPGVPVVFGAVDQREVKARTLGPDVIGVPMTVSMAPTLDLALHLHPGTRRVFVVAGKSKTDAYWAGEARREFRGYEGEVEFVYLTGLPWDDLLRRVADLPDRSVIYYLHLFEDALGNTFIPAEVVGPLSSAANAPVYGHYSTYVGRGIVGGRVVRFEDEGTNASRIVARILAGGAPGTIPLPEAAESPYQFDWRELRRWGIGEGELPRGSVVLDRAPSFWELFKWRVIGGLVLCVAEALLIVALLLERKSRMRAEEVLRERQRELGKLTGRMLEAQESERRRIARELHDDLNQSLALIAVELDLIAQNPTRLADTSDARVREISGRVKQLSSAVHDLSHQLHPTKLEQLGLVAAVGGLCRELSSAHGLLIEFDAGRLTSTIPADTALCLYRIAQEALSNVIKHSGARQARVELRGGPEAVFLSIADDGSGFDPGSVAGKGGLGLVGMRERLRLVGGQISVDSRPSGGTRIDVRTPMVAPADAPPGDTSHGRPMGVS